MISSARLRIEFFACTQLIGSFTFSSSVTPSAWAICQMIRLLTTVLPEKGLAVAVQCPEWGDFDKVKLALHEVFFSQL